MALSWSLNRRIRATPERDVEVELDLLEAATRWAELPLRFDYIQRPLPNVIWEETDPDGESFLAFQWDPERPIAWTQSQAVKTEEFLIAFANLSKPNAGPKQIVRFAKRHGLLCVCEHGANRVRCSICAARVWTELQPQAGLKRTDLSEDWTAEEMRRTQLDVSWMVEELRWRGQVGDLAFATSAPLSRREPITAWKRYARRVRSALMVTGQVQARQNPRPADCADLGIAPNQSYESTAKSLDTPITVLVDDLRSHCVWSGNWTLSGLRRITWTIDG